jgi:hypothetical protein
MSKVAKVGNFLCFISFCIKLSDAVNHYIKSLIINDLQLSAFPLR